MKCDTIKYSWLYEEELEQVAEALNIWFDAHPSVQVRHITQIKGIAKYVYILTTIYYE